jgi:hypothetical protein
MARNTYGRVTEVTENKVLRKTSHASACKQFLQKDPSAGHFSHQDPDTTSTLECLKIRTPLATSDFSGSRGHDALFRVAGVLAHSFDLSDEQAWPILIAFNARRF